MAIFSAEMQAAQICEAEKAQHANESPNAECEIPTECLQGFDYSEYQDWTTMCPPRLRRPAHDQEPTSTHDCQRPTFEMEKVWEAGKAWYAGETIMSPPRLRRLVHKQEPTSTHDCQRP